MCCLVIIFSLTNVFEYCGFCRQEHFKGLGMSGVSSDVLGKDVSSGSVGNDKIDGATGLQ